MDASLAHRIYQQADDAWQAELERVYGSQAGDARYDHRGTATRQLADLKEARYQAMLDYHAKTTWRPLA